VTNLWDGEDPDSAWWRLAHDPVALMADAKRQHAAKLYAEGKVERLERLQYLSESVYVLYDDTPDDCGERLLGVFSTREAASTARLLKVGAAPVKMQYLDVQKWRVKK